MFIECHAAIPCYALLCSVSLRLTMCGGLSLRNSQTMSRMCELPGEFCKFCIYCDELVPFDCFFLFVTRPCATVARHLGIDAGGGSWELCLCEEGTALKICQDESCLLLSEFCCRAAGLRCLLQFTEKIEWNILERWWNFIFFEGVGPRCIFIFFRNMKETTAIETYESWYDYVFDYDYDYDMIRYSMMWHVYIYIHIHIHT